MKVNIIVDTEENQLILKGPVPGLLWGELVNALSDYSKFEKGKTGTRFDRWLPIRPQ